MHHARARVVPVAPCQSTSRSGVSVRRLRDRILKFSSVFAWADATNLGDIPTLRDDTATARLMALLPRAVPDGVTGHSDEIVAAARNLRQCDAPDWASIDYEFGYSSQQHFITDFRTELGATPLPHKKVSSLGWNLWLHVVHFGAGNDAICRRFSECNRDPHSGHSHTSPSRIASAYVASISGPGSFVSASTGGALAASKGVVAERALCSAGGPLSRGCCATAQGLGHCARACDGIHL